MTSDERAPGPVREGLLDLAVNLSSPEIFSGTDFALYPHVKNPFARPVWIQKVIINLPAAVHQKVEETRSAETERSGDELGPEMRAKLVDLSARLDERVVETTGLRHRRHVR